MTSSLVRRIAGAAAVLTLASCGANDPGSVPPGPAPVVEATWEPVSAVPLSPRTDPVIAWTGNAVLVIGGNTGFVCPPNADCIEPTELAADGALFDPVSGSWRAIADAPVELMSGWYCQPCSAVVGGRLIVDARNRSGPNWLAYDPMADTWETLDAPGGRFDLAQHDDDNIWGFQGRRIVAWDPATGEVRVAATYDPERPLDDPALVLTGGQAVVTGVRYDSAAPDEPTLTQVDVPDGSGGWRRIETGQIGWLRHWTGYRLVGVEPGSADGGETNAWDRAYPYAGALDLETGEWQPVDVPARPDDSWPISAESGPLVVTGGLYVDVRELDWSVVGKPGSELDTALTSVWADEQLFVFGGVDEEVGYEHPGGPEAWLWTPPGQ